jgi:hypothetical protein
MNADKDRAIPVYLRACPLSSEAALEKTNSAIEAQETAAMFLPLLCAPVTKFFLISSQLSDSIY